MWGLSEGALSPEFLFLDCCLPLVANASPSPFLLRLLCQPSQISPTLGLTIFPRQAKRKFSSFFKSLVIELDKDLYGPDNHLVEWHRTTTTQETDGFQVRLGIRTELSTPGGGVS